MSVQKAYMLSERADYLEMKMIACSSYFSSCKGEKSLKKAVKKNLDRYRQEYKKARIVSSNYHIEHILKPTAKNHGIPMKTWALIDKKMDYDLRRTYCQTLLHYIKKDENEFRTLLKKEKKDYTKEINRIEKEIDLCFKAGDDFILPEHRRLKWSPIQ